MGYRYRNCKNATGEEGLPGEPIQKAFGVVSWEGPEKHSIFKVCGYWPKFSLRRRKGKKASFDHLLKTPSDWFR